MPQIRYLKWKISDRFELCSYSNRTVFLREHATVEMHYEVWELDPMQKLYRKWCIYAPCFCLFLRHRKMSYLPLLPYWLRSVQIFLVLFSWIDFQNQLSIEQSNLRLHNFGQWELGILKIYLGLFNSGLFPLFCLLFFLQAHLYLFRFLNLRLHQKVWYFRLLKNYFKVLEGLNEWYWWQRISPWICQR